MNHARKQRFNTRAEAVAVARKVKHKRAAKLTPYQCRVNGCGGWHLTGFAAESPAAVVALFEAANF